MMSDTVTVTFITNHEIDPDEVDLRYKKPEKVLEQLKKAATNSYSIQEYASGPIPVTRAEMDKERRRIKEARGDDA